MYFAFYSIFDFKYFDTALENHCLVKLNQYTLNNARNGKLIVFSLFCLLEAMINTYGEDRCSRNCEIHLLVSLSW